MALIPLRPERSVTVSGKPRVRRLLVKQISANIPDLVLGLRRRFSGGPNSQISGVDVSASGEGRNHRRLPNLMAHRQPCAG
jgi:hypothetical protein